MNSAFGPDGNLYVADLQMFWDGAHKSRVLRINVEDGKAVSMEVVVEGLIVANGTAWRGDTLYVTETILRHTPQTEEDQSKLSLLSGVYAFQLEEFDRGPIRLIPYGKPVVLFNTFNSRFKSEEIDGLGRLIAHRGGRLIDHVYVRRGRILNQLSGNELMERVRDVLDTAAGRWPVGGAQSVQRNSADHS